MSKKDTMTIHLDAECVEALKQLKRQIDANAPDGMPVFSLQALARHAIRKWCDHTAAPVPRPWESQADSEA